MFGASSELKPASAILLDLRVGTLLEEEEEEEFGFYSTKIQSVGLRKRPCYHYPSEKVMSQ